MHIDETTSDLPPICSHHLSSCPQQNMNVVQTAGAMSVPQGPRGRSGSRGRGVPRGGLKPRDPQDARGEKPNGQRPSNNATRGTDSQHRLKPPPNQGHVRNKTWSNPASLNAAALNAAVQSHAGKIPDLRKEAWRNPARTDSRTYKERMNDLYQTVCISSPGLLTRRYA